MNSTLSMLEKEPLITYAWMIGISALGGIAGYLRKLRQGLTKRFSLTEIICEIIISIFVGSVTLLLCDAQGFDKSTTGALVGLAGHLGSRAIYILEVMICKRTGIDLVDQDRRQSNNNPSNLKRRASDNETI
jgi:hypothetical protein